MIYLKVETTNDNNEEEMQRERWREEKRKQRSNYSLQKRKKTETRNDKNDEELQRERWREQKRKQRINYSLQKHADINRKRREKRLQQKLAKEAEELAKKTIIQTGTTLSDTGYEQYLEENWIVFLKQEEESDPMPAVNPHPAPSPPHIPLHPSPHPSQNRKRKTKQEANADFRQKRKEGTEGYTQYLEENRVECKVYRESVKGDEEKREWRTELARQIMARMREKRWLQQVSDSTHQNVDTRNDKNEEELEAEAKEAEELAKKTVIQTGTTLSDTRYEQYLEENRVVCLKQEEESDPMPALNAHPAPSPPHIPLHPSPQPVQSRKRKTKQEVNAKYRQKRKEDTERYTQYLEENKVKCKAYRESMKGDEEKRQWRNERARQRMAKMREKRRLQQVSDNTHQNAETRNDKNEEELQRERWREQKRKQRINYSLQKHTDINRKRREKRLQQKLAKEAEELAKKTVIQTGTTLSDTRYEQYLEENRVVCLKQEEESDPMPALNAHPAPSPPHIPLHPSPQPVQSRKRKTKQEANADFRQNRKEDTEEYTQYLEENRVECKVYRESVKGDEEKREWRNELAKQTMARMREKTRLQQVSANTHQTIITRNDKNEEELQRERWREEKRKQRSNYSLQKHTDINRKRREKRLEQKLAKVLVELPKKKESTMTQIETTLTD